MGCRQCAPHPWEAWTALPNDKHLRELIDNLRAMAVRYRKWAEQANKYQAEEFLQLADSSEQSANELEEILRRKGNP